MADLTSTLCYEELVARINQQAGHALPLVIAVDGCGGAGKSRFARRLADSLRTEILSAHSNNSTAVNAAAVNAAAGNATAGSAISAKCPAQVQIVRMDDFYKPSLERLPQRESEAAIGSDFDWQRLRNQVLAPLSRGEAAHYQRYDWDNDQLAEWHDLSLDSITIVEGIYSTRHELACFYNLTCWVYCSRSQRLDRGIERDGEAKRVLWEKYWMPAEERYVELEEPHKRAKLLVDGSGCSENISVRCGLDTLFTARDH